MTASKPSRTCPECVHDGGWHWTDDLEPRAYRCPNYLAAESQAAAQKLTADANSAAFKAAKQIIADAAAKLPEFSGNTVRDEMEAAQIPSGVIGAAFSWARREGLIEPTGRRVMSTEDTTRHRIEIWTSLAFGKRGVA